jgi:hypothetical protein
MVNLKERGLVKLSSDNAPLSLGLLLDLLLVSHLGKKSVCYRVISCASVIFDFESDFASGTGHAAPQRFLTCFGQPSSSGIPSGCNGMEGFLFPGVSLPLVPRGTW